MSGDRRSGRAIGLGLLIALAPFFAACSTNPATGEQSFTAFMSPEDEMTVGAEEHPKILKRFNGPYQDHALARYVREIGLSLARLSERPDLPYTFTVLNDDAVNAFALPGGYVYVTRGLLAMATNEAETAGVLAHEIGHIVARHTAQRYSQAIAANIGLTILGVIGSAAGVPAGLGDIASFGASAYLQGFSREQELQADMLGVRYMTRAGYDANGMVSFFQKLEEQKKLEAAIAGNPAAADRFGIFDTHPRTPDRIRQAIQLARAAPGAGARTEADVYLANIDGILFGDDPKEGVRSGRHFAHPGLRFAFTVPPGFSMFNSPQRVLAKGPGGAMILFQELNLAKAGRQRDPYALLSSGYVTSLRLSGIERISVNAMDAATGTGRATAGGREMDVRVVVFRQAPDRLYQMVLLTPPNLTRQLEVELRRTTYSFRTLTPEEANQVKPLRVRVVTVGPGDTAESLASRIPFESHRIEWFEVLNGYRRGQPLPVGAKVKIVAE